MSELVPGTRGVLKPSSDYYKSFAGLRVEVLPRPDGKNTNMSYFKPLENRRDLVYEENKRLPFFLYTSYFITDKDETMTYTAGTRVTLTLGDTTIKGKVVSYVSDVRRLNVRIEGCVGYSNFDLSDGWTVTPDYPEPDRSHIIKSAKGTLYTWDPNRERWIRSTDGFGFTWATMRIYSDIHPFTSFAPVQ